MYVIHYTRKRGESTVRTDKTVKTDLLLALTALFQTVSAPADACRRVAVYGGGPDAIGGDGGEQGEYQHGFGIGATALPGIGPVLAQRIIDRRTE